MLMPFFNWHARGGVPFGFFAVMAVFAGLRSTGSSALGLDQLPAHRPGAMMGARTASAQLGYMIGAVPGGGGARAWRLRHARLRPVRGDGSLALLLSRVTARQGRLIGGRLRFLRTAT